MPLILIVAFLGALLASIYIRSSRIAAYLDKHAMEVLSQRRLSKLSHQGSLRYRYELPCFEVFYRAKDANVYLELLQYSHLTGIKRLERRFLAGS